MAGMDKLAMLKGRRPAGFTIVELLIVVVIIGILAAIVIVAYNGVTSTAKENAIKSDLANVAKKLEVYKAINGSYPTQAIAQLDAADFKVNQSNYDINRNNFYYCISTDTYHYAIGVDTTNNTEYYMRDGAIILVANGSVNGANTCQHLITNGFPAGAGGSAGHDFSTGTGWAAWTL